MSDVTQLFDGRGNGSGPAPRYPQVDIGSLLHETLPAGATHLPRRGRVWSIDRDGDTGYRRFHVVRLDGRGARRAVLDEPNCDPPEPPYSFDIYKLVKRALDLALAPGEWQRPESDEWLDIALRLSRAL